MDVVSGQTLAAFVDAIGADRPAPGCGAAGATCLALAAACVRKAFTISARHRGGDAALVQAAEEAGRIARVALDEAQQDAADFTALLHAHRGDQGPAEALEADGEAVLALASALRDLVGRHRDRVDEIMQGDLVGALAMTDAAERVQRRNLTELSGA